MIPVMKVAFNDIQQETVTDDKGQVASPCLDCKWSVKSGIIINLQSGGPSSLFVFEATFVLSLQKRMSDCRLSVADPGEGPRPRPRPRPYPLPLFLDQTEAWSVKNFLFLGPVLPLISRSGSGTGYGIIGIKFSLPRLKLFISM